MKVDPRVPASGELQSGGVHANRTETTAAQPQVRPANTPATQTQDTFQPSSRHTEVHDLTAQVAKVPDVRTERVAAYQAQVQNGTYKPNSASLASAILSQQNPKTTKG